MTAQLHDIVRIGDREYDCVQVEGAVLFDAAVEGLMLRPTCTACWRGYRCVFHLAQDQLYLETLYVSLGDTDAPNLDGVAATAPERGEPFSHYYRRLHRPVAFSGELILARGPLPERTQHMGFRAPWQYREVLVARFIGGRMVDVNDISGRMERLRADKDAPAPSE